jgi:hypothetical protein
MNLIKKAFFALSFLLCCQFAKANISPLAVDNYSIIDSTPSIPRVFVLGQYDGAPFERMKADYETSLLTVCKNDMETAYYCWAHLMKHIESHAVKSNFDMNGIKLWVYAFWEKDGTLAYLAYYPKPNSKNFKAEEMNSFLNDFCKIYTAPYKYDKPFSNYSTASFPVMVEKTPVSNGTGSATSKSPTSNRNSGQH